MTVIKRFLVKENDNTWLDHVSSSNTTTKGIIRAAKCDIYAVKSLFDYKLVVRDKVSSEPVEYEFNATGPVIDAITRFLSDDVETCDEYSVIQNGQSWHIKDMPSGKTIAEIELKDDETVISPSWLGEQIE